MESEDVQERERLVEQNLTDEKQNLTLDKGGHTQLHIVKAHPVSQVLHMTTYDI